MSETCWTRPPEPRYGGQVSDFEALYRAVESRDARWDGRVFVGVTSTSIYCRPICPVPMPRKEHVRFYANAASAERAGFRACRRCRPEQSPGSPDWDVRADLVGRALRLISGGMADESGVDGVARALAVSPRHLHRLFVREVGVGPAEIARTRAGRAGQAAPRRDRPLEHRRRLHRRIPLAPRLQRCAAALVRARYPRSRAEPTAEVEAARPVPESGCDWPTEPRSMSPACSLRRRPGHPGVEAVDDRSIRRAIRTAGGMAMVRLAPVADALAIDLVVDDVGPGELAGLVRAARRSLDLDADPAAIDAALASRSDRRPARRRPRPGVASRVRSTHGRRRSSRSSPRGPHSRRLGRRPVASPPRSANRRSSTTAGRPTVPVARAARRRRPRCHRGPRRPAPTAGDRGGARPTGRRRVDRPRGRRRSPSDARGSPVRPRRRTVDGRLRRDAGAPRSGRLPTRRRGDPGRLPPPGAGRRRPLDRPRRRVRGDRGAATRSPTCGRPADGGLPATAPRPAVPPPVGRLRCRPADGRPGPHRPRPPRSRRAQTGEPLSGSADAASPSSTDPVLPGAD